jgi:hypothetical protein
MQGKLLSTVNARGERISFWLQGDGIVGSGQLVVKKVTTSPVLRLQRGHHRERGGAHTCRW